MVRILATLAFVAVCAGPAAAFTSAPADPVQAVAAAQITLTHIEAQARASSDDKQLADLRTQALAVQATADQSADSLNPRLVAVDARLGQLGPAPADRRAEAPAIRQERQSLAATRATIDGQIKQAKLLSVAAQQAADQIADQRRSAFNQRVFRRGDSPLSPQLWRVLAGDLPSDLGRIRRIGTEEASAARAGADDQAWLILAGSVLAAAAVGVGLKLWLEALGRRWATRDAPPTRLRRSGVAVWRLLVGALTPGLAAMVLLYGLTWAGVLSSRVHRFAVVATFVTFWIAFVASLGDALLSPGRQSWRLPPLSDRAAQKARLYPLLVAVVSGAGLLLERINSLVGASLAATVAANAVITVVYCVLALAVLIALGRSRSEPDPQDRNAAAKTSAWSLIALAVGAAVIASLGAVLAGYTALGVFIVRQTVWISVLTAFLYLALQFVDDLFSQLFRPGSRVGRGIHVVFALRPSSIDQLGAVLSAVVRLTILLFGISAVLAPFGAGAGALASELRGLAGGVRIGGVEVSPLAVLSAVAAFLVGIVLVRGVQRWLDRDYLPRTEWDLGVRNSVSTAVGYLGIALTAVWALASLGLGLQRVALIASALSVGIGFGLQQIVQNFISGVIMLIERPVKVGDWVVVDGLEGDIQRINVRATEIRMFDRSTVLLPNSDFITKPVQNKTRNDPLGRIQVQFAIASGADAGRARDILQAAFKADREVLTEPEPKVFIDSLTAAGVVLNCYVYVATPRSVYPVRSALYFAILEALVEAGVELAGASQTMRIVTSGQGGPAGLSGGSESIDAPAPGGAPPP